MWPEIANDPELQCENWAVVMRFRGDSSRPNNDSNDVFLREQIFKCVEVVAHGKTQPLPASVPLCDPSVPDVVPPDCIPPDIGLSDMGEDYNHDRG